MKAEKVKEPRARDVLLTFVKTRLNGEEISLSDLCDEVERDFPHDFFERLGREELRRIIYFFVEGYIQPSKAASRLLKGGSPKSIFAAWYEEVGRNRKVNLLQMTKEDLFDAASIRRLRADGETRRASFLEELSERLSEGDTVGSKWGMEEISDLFKSKMTTRNKTA